jgi:uncharacterized protein (UPF0218 family)
MRTPTIKLTRSLRRMLKEPFGEVVSGSRDEVLKTLTALERRLKPRKVICVGDAVSRLTLKSPIKVNLRIIDNKERRMRVGPVDYEARHVFKLHNPPGMIVEEAWIVVRQAVKTDESLVIVDGEEDLLALVAASEAPVGSLLLYGQPKAGVVAVEVNKDLKRRVGDILSLMRWEFNRKITAQ